MTTVQDIPEIKVLEYRMTLGMTTMEGRGFYAPTDVGIAEDGRMYVANRSLENVTRGVRVTMCDIDSEYYGTFAAYGTSPGQFVWPSACNLDSRGRVYVSDEATHRISVFDREGALLSTWGEHGAGEGQLDTPSGLAFDAEDNVYVADTYNHRVQKFTADGRFLLAFGSRGQRRRRVQPAVGPDRGRRRVRVRGRLGERPGAEVRRRTGRTWHRSGRRGGATGSFTGRREWRWTPTGTSTWRTGGTSGCRCWSRDGGFVQKLRGEATLSAWAANFLAINVEEGEARSRANLEPEIEYFVDDPHEESSHIEKYFWSPVSVKLDRDGNLYVTESNRHRIQVYSPNQPNERMKLRRESPSPQPSPTRGEGVFRRPLRKS